MKDWIDKGYLTFNNGFLSLMIEKKITFITTEALMNTKENQMAIVKKSFCGNAGKRVLVLHEEGIDSEHGLMWRVRFSRPTLVLPFSIENGKFSPVGLVCSNEAVLPDAWLMGLNIDPQSDSDAANLLSEEDQVNWMKKNTPIDIDFSEKETAPGMIDADLVWPEGWV